MRPGSLLLSSVYLSVCPSLSPSNPHAHRPRTRVDSLPLSTVVGKPPSPRMAMDREPSSGRSSTEAGKREASASPLGEDGRKEHARPRKRTRRACDKCSASRTRCDGELPWYVQTPSSHLRIPSPHMRGSVRLTLTFSLFPAGVVKVRHVKFAFSLGCGRSHAQLHFRDALYESHAF